MGAPTPQPRRGLLEALGMKLALGGRAAAFCFQKLTILISFAFSPYNYLYFILFVFSEVVFLLGWVLCVFFPFKCQQERGSLSRGVCRGEGEAREKHREGTSR